MECGECGRLGFNNEKKGTIMPSARSRKLKDALERSSVQVKNRLRLLHRVRGHVQADICKFEHLSCYSPLVQSLQQFDALLAEGEKLFCDAHFGQISDVDLERFLGDYIRHLGEALAEHRPSYFECDDLESDVAGEWNDFARLIEQLQDGLQSIAPALPECLERIDAMQ